MIYYIRTKRKTRTKKVLEKIGLKEKIVKERLEKEFKFFQ
jgi:hypothetical protein